MIFVPGPIGSTQLKYPENRWRIALLSQPAKEAWYAAQEPKDLIERSKDFERFWKTWYLGHIKLKRFFYSFKFW